MGQNTIKIKLFGTLELENQHGRVAENSSYKSLPWLLLKYLLVNSSREVGQEEIKSVLWPEQPDIDLEMASRVCLSRLRKALAPLQLNGLQQGLVLFTAGQYSINPNFQLEMDCEEFLTLLPQIQMLPVTDPAGLELCLRGLEIFRRPFLQHTQEGLWLRQYRQSYQRLFCSLAHSTLERTKALGDERALTLLCQRAAAIVPEEEQLHRAIIGYLMERKRELDLLRHVSQLSHTGSSGAAWLKEIAL